MTFKSIDGALSSGSGNPTPTNGFACPHDSGKVAPPPQMALILPTPVTMWDYYSTYRLMEVKKRANPNRTQSPTHYTAITYGEFGILGFLKQTHRQSLFLSGFSLPSADRNPTYSSTMATRNAR